jgi:predicted aspartyl protease
MGSKSLFAAILFSGVCLAVAPLFGGTTEPSSQPSAGALAEFPIEHWGEPITIPVVWGGKPACFVLDTNASVTVLNAADFPGLEPFGRNASVGTSGGQRAMQLFHPPDLHVGPFSLADAGHVFRLDLSDLRAMIGRPVIGFLGVSALKGSVVQVDFDARKVRFLQPDNQPHPEWGTSLPMPLNAEHNPAVRLSIGGVERSLGIDTASNGFIDLPSQAFDRLPDLARQPVLSISSLTANGTVKLRVVRMPEVELAGSRYHDLICKETRHATGTLGLEFLERNLATLNFPGNRLYLKPGKEFDHPSEASMSGIHAGRVRDQLVAQVVDVGSPAYEAGVREGDILVDLNGKPAGDYDMPDVRDLMHAGEGKEMTLTFRHGDSQQTVKFILRRAI